MKIKNKKRSIERGARSDKDRSPEKKALAIQIINSCRQRVPRKFLQSWVNMVTNEFSPSDRKKVMGKVLTLVFLQPSKAKKLNYEFRGKNYATDVLSFSGIESGELGELVLCPAVLHTQAQDHKLTYQEELGYMIIHGLLHLLGYEHEKSSGEARKMFRLQDRIFDKLR